MAQYFPHLNEGIGAQFPIRRTTRYRTVVNASDLHTSLRATDPGARRIAWWLRYQGLADNEMASLQSFFRAVRGPLDSFVFLDPEANLLAYSEDLEVPAWEKTAGLALAAAPSAPAEAQQAFRLTASGQSSEIYQTVHADASHRWVLSVYACAPGGGAITLLLRSASGEESITYALGSEWKRIHFGGHFWSAGETVEAGVRLDAGASADIAGFQLEVQCSPSRYKRSSANSGVYAEARFAQDTLRVTTLGPNCHQTALIVTAPLPN
ncbi:MAG: hypothetical protein IT169_00180 [Bryobacterales bacterium]|nr:hypothetical protein [Bryobacterales bacterium]